jgi:hypothetical protein
MSTTSAKLTVEDSNPPVIEKIAQDISVECEDSERTTIIQDWLNNAANAKAQDLCGEVAWTNDYVAPSEDCVGETSIEVIFTATDPCGNNVTTIGIIKNVISTGLNDLFRKENLLIYPNPASSVIHIDLEGLESFQKKVSLFDMNGKLMWQQNNAPKTMTINVEHLRSGVYIVQLTSVLASTSKKVIVE